MRTAPITREHQRIRQPDHDRLSWLPTGSPKELAVVIRPGDILQRSWMTADNTTPQPELINAKRWMCV